MPNFAGLWCPNYLTQGYSWGIIGKIISVAFIWYLVVLCVTDSLVTIASWKSGLILSTLKMLISVLSNKAALGTGYRVHLQRVCRQEDHQDFISGRLLPEEPRVGPPLRKPPPGPRRGELRPNPQPGAQPRAQAHRGKGPHHPGRPRHRPLTLVHHLLVY